jgi:hypothetical protein
MREQMETEPKCERKGNMKEWKRIKRKMEYDTVQVGK